MSASKQIRKNSEKISIKEPEKNLSYPVFCFKHLTTNNNYNIKFFKKARDKQKAYGAFFYLMDRMQSISWQEFIQLPKKVGMESISPNQINFTPKDYKITPDQKVICLRFKRQNYRAIGLKESINGVDVFHVIGFDFDYSSYDHGK